MTKIMKHQVGQIYFQVVEIFNVAEEWLSASGLFSHLNDCCG